jgi:Q-cell neuroblast polarisation
MEEGLSSLVADNITEFNEGLTINSIRRFHIMPEVILSFLYRHFMLLAAYLNIPVINCYYVEPDENSKIDDEKVFVNCEGLGEPIFFLSRYYMESLGNFNFPALHVRLLLASKLLCGLCDYSLFLL